MQMIRLTVLCMSCLIVSFAINMVERTGRYHMEKEASSGQALLKSRDAGTSALTKKQLNCPQHADTTMWGIWIDGRDSSRGANAYGKTYGHRVKSALQVIYDTPVESQLDYDLFEKIRNKIGASWRPYPNPVLSEVGTCHHSALPSARVEQIMSHISVEVQNNFKDPYPLPSWKNIKIIKDLFANYSAALRSDPPVDVALNHLGVLLQNLAFLHPLRGSNGRARLLLLQYALRQQGIACGTMMYNNNKNIYFDTLPEFVDKIKEGITMYNDAWSSGFAINPWEASTNASDIYSERFSHPWSAKLQACWASRVNGNVWANGTVPI